MSTDSTISASRSFSSSPISISFLQFNCSNKLVNVIMSSSPGGCSLHCSVNSVSEVLSVVRCMQNPCHDNLSRVSSSMVSLFWFHDVRYI